MKIEHHYTLEQTQNIVSTAYSMKITAETFELLFKKPYKNPIRSIIRELTSNAYDAHVEAGTTDLPIEITFPTAIHPTFTIKDYGTGLSPTEMIEVYTVGFNSTRNQSNQYMGGYGLGSKTPFSYTDQYVVNSRYHGIEREYLVFIDKQGIPQLSEALNTTPTVEPNGLTIKIPVAPNDFYTFYREGDETLLLFPNIKSNRELPKLTPLLETPTAIIADTLSYNPLYAIIGHVVYPIAHKDFNNLQYTYDSIPSLYLKFAIGDLHITINKEDLLYDDHTIEQINQAIETARIELTQKAQDTVLTTPSYNAACCSIAPILPTLKLIRADVETLRHPTEPKKQLSTHINIELPNCRCSKLPTKQLPNASSIVVPVTKFITVYWIAQTSKYKKEILKTLQNRTADSHFVIIGDDFETLEETLDQELIHPVTYHTPSVEPPTRYRNPPTIKCTAGYVVDPYEDNVLCVTLTPTLHFLDTPFNASHVPTLKKLLNAYEFAIIPKSSKAKFKGVSWLTDYLPQLRALCEQNLPIINKLNTLEAHGGHPRFGISHLRRQYPFHPLVTMMDEIITLYQYTSLLEIATLLKIPLTVDSTLIKGIIQTQNKYRSVIDNGIEDPTVIHMVDYYLEHHHD